MKLKIEHTKMSQNRNIVENIFANANEMPFETEEKSIYIKEKYL